ncbi:WALL ASSOCIATED KINASE (WAK)-LIKE 10 [Hibiscus trionum]|uniref:WALL ASSOCIATED KINASE (WAK)-LIKE 10 n=1 Tax=Hibiscus trionum TaxID=183268 RepID=A0A9W7MK36_HIBTR|nr:WALL ASSOCIATED KINASE (WAK)-LIKE 10 [Hibiscus trionum]
MAKLARRCLNLNRKKRPTMKQVAMELELIKAWKAGDAIEEVDEESETYEIIEFWNANLSWSTSISITTESTTLPLNLTF